MAARLKRNLGFVWGSPAPDAAMQTLRDSMAFHAERLATGPAHHKSHHLDRLNDLRAQLHKRLGHGKAAFVRGIVHAERAENKRR